jgi:hypothetical protein
MSFDVFPASLHPARLICSLGKKMMRVRLPFLSSSLISLQVGKMAQVVHMTKKFGFQVLSGSASLLLPALAVGEYRKNKNTAGTLTAHVNLHSPSCVTLSS